MCIIIFLKTKESTHFPNFAMYISTTPFICNNCCKIPYFGDHGPMEARCSAGELVTTERGWQLKATTVEVWTRPQMLVAPNVASNVRWPQMWKRPYMCKGSMNVHLVLTSTRVVFAHRELYSDHLSCTLREISGTYWVLLTHLGESGYCHQINLNYQVNRPTCCKFSGQWPRSLWNPRRWKSQFTPQSATQFTVVYHWEVSVRISLWHFVFMEICLIFYYIVVRGYIY